MKKANFIARASKSGGQIWAIIPRNIRAYLGLEAGQKVYVDITIPERGKEWHGERTVQRTGNSLGIVIPKDLRVNPRHDWLMVHIELAGGANGPVDGKD